MIKSHPSQRYLYFYGSQNSPQQDEVQSQHLFEVKSELIMIDSIIIIIVFSGDE